MTTTHEIMENVKKIKYRTTILKLILEINLCSKSFKSLKDVYNVNISFLFLHLVPSYIYNKDNNICVPLKQIED